MLWHESLQGPAMNVRLCYSQVMNNVFWKKLNELVDLCWPIVVLLRAADSGKPMIGQVGFHSLKRAHNPGCSFQYVSRGCVSISYLLLTLGLLCFRLLI
jgi:hypothetical protein